MVDPGCERTDPDCGRTDPHFWRTDPDCVRTDPHCYRMDPDGGRAKCDCKAWLAPSIFIISVVLEVIQRYICHWPLFGHYWKVDLPNPIVRDLMDYSDCQAVGILKFYHLNPLVLAQHKLETYLLNMHFFVALQLPQWIQIYSVSVLEMQQMDPSPLLD